jgi:phosphatidylinositol glycan class W
MIVVTCVAILAVDFRVFPRRFAKVENWGTSLMDMGVGSFVFSAGVVAAKPVLKDARAGKSTGLAQRLYVSIRHALPLLVLGLIRLWSVKGLDYAEHVTEYGVHWNFFFTLAFLPPFVAIFQSFFALIPSYAILAILLGATYQAALEFTSLKAFILVAPRTDLFSKNREGIFSFFGYLAIFLAGQATGLYILPRDNSTQPKTSTSSKQAYQRHVLGMRLFTWSLIWTALAALAVSYKFGLNLAISRRLANLPYFLWVCAFNTTQILLFCLIETVIFPSVYGASDPAVEKRESEKATPRVLKAYNRNGLAIFLLANLLTGLVNMTVDTLGARTTMSMGILVAYMGVITAVAVFLDAKNISIKI